MNNTQVNIDAIVIESLPTKLLKNSSWYYSMDTKTTYKHKNYALRFLLPFDICSHGGVATFPRIYKDSSLIFHWSHCCNSDMHQTMAFKVKNFHNPFIGDSIMLEKYSGDLVILNLKKESIIDLSIKKATFHDASLSEELFLVSTEEKIYLIDEKGDYKYEYLNEKGRYPAFTKCFWHNKKNYFFTINHRLRSSGENFFELNINNLKTTEPIAKISLLQLVNEQTKSKRYDADCCFTYDDVENILYLSLKSMNKCFEEKILAVKVDIK